MFIVRAEQATFDEGEAAIVFYDVVNGLLGETPATYVETTYNIWVGGVQVAEAWVFVQIA